MLALEVAVVLERAELLYRIQNRVDANSILMKMLNLPIMLNIVFHISNLTNVY